MHRNERRRKNLKVRERGENGGKKQEGEAFFDYFKKKLYRKEVEHFGQEVTESATAKLQIGMAKKTRMRIMSIQSESFFLIFKITPQSSDSASSIEL
jgi:hypothetical protein